MTAISVATEIVNGNATSGLAIVILGNTSLDIVIFNI
jgi:hypothetical protein